ncbi:hypothetical protein KIPB_001064 [Kipferlia bialata]|uniref:Uncharacterized protein n=1 Tax=Kipferlia bialata TaxID=797122 RepID=A0A9K3CQ40_9EUKA|nr:hypothetical protein KIPB_001064 [Kipferlia bialata]|eukprot:g1064.t1
MGSSTAEKLQERQEEEARQKVPKDQRVSVKDMRCSNDMFLVMRMMQGNPLPPFPDFVQETLKHGYPKGLPRHQVKEHLEVAYENLRCLPDKMETSRRDPSWKVVPHELRKRLHGTWSESWYVGARVGSVCHLRKPPNKGYSNTVRHNFSNQTYTPTPMYSGTTHVAVGFVDLGTLLCADIQSGGRGEREGGEGATPQPLSFVGYELCAFAVAKTMVVWHMLCEGEASHYERAVLQVWYSSTWDLSTEALFRDAASSLLSTASSLPPPVSSILSHWADPSLSPSVPLSRARGEWLSLQSPTSSFLAGSLVRRKDRVAVGTYNLTGDFARADASAKKARGRRRAPKPRPTGSLSMFSCPDGIAPSAGLASVFSVVPFRECLQCARNMSGSATVLDGVREWLGVRLRALRERGRAGSVSVSLRLGDVTDYAVTREVSVLSPRTMSWSNVLDYVPNKVLHGLARRCGGVTCTHSGYTMNWGSVTKGASLMDYPDTKGRCQILDLALDTAKRVNKAEGLDPILRSPLPEHPFNISDLFLQYMLYPQWLGAWARAGGLEVVSGKGGERGVEGWVLGTKGDSSPLSATGDAAVYLTWGYGRVPPALPDATPHPIYGAMRQGWNRLWKLSPKGAVGGSDM